MEESEIMICVNCGHKIVKGFRGKPFYKDKLVHSKHKSWKTDCVCGCNKPAERLDG